MGRGSRGGHRPPAVEVEGVLAEAASAHRAGRLDEAEARYRAVLRLRPHDAEATHLLGVVALQKGRAAEAVDLIRTAIRVDGSVAAYHDNLGSALNALGRFDEAAAAHLHALNVNAFLEKAWLNLGNALSAGGHRSAARSYLNAVLVRPDYAKGWFNLGNTLRERNPAAAAAAFRRAQTLAPEMIDARINLGLALASSGRLDEATAIAREVVRARPDLVEGWYNLGVVLQRRSAPEEAELVYREALRREPRHVGALNNLGSVLRRLGRPTDAERLHRAALELAPDFVEALFNLGNALRLLNRIEEAEVCWREATRRRPDLAGPAFNLGRVFLARGDLDRGWAAEERRFTAGEAKPDRKPRVPRWEGAPIAGRLLVWREQGVGDEILLSQLYPEIAARVARPPIFEADSRLVSLFRRSFPTLEIRAETLDPQGRETAVTPDIGAHLPAGSAPRYTRPRLSAFPRRPNRLIPDAARVADARAWLGTLPPGLRVGLSWTSGLIDVERKLCYTALLDWAPVLTLPGVTAINLQYGPVEDEIAAVERALGVVVHRPPGIDLKDDFEGLAALVGSLDLVISVGTAVGELAGAVGAPVWRAGFQGEWTALGSACRPWFPTMRVVGAARFAPGVSEIPHRIAADLARLAVPRGIDLDMRLDAAIGAHRAGRAADAERGYREVLDVDPRHVDANHLLGVSLHQTGRREEAEARMRAALAVDPLFAGAWNSLGLVWDAVGRAGDAERAFARATVCDPASPEAWSHLGLLRRAAGRVAEAIVAGRRAVRVSPGDAVFTTNLGSAVESSGDFAAAEILFRRAAVLDPTSGDALNNIGNAIRLVERETGFGVWFDRAHRAAPDHPLAAWNAGLLDLERGRLDAGWRGFSRRFDALPRMGRRRPSAPEWRGEPLPGGTLMVWGEQGVGDEILFSPFAVLPTQLVGRVIFECDPRLVGLFARSFPQIEVRAARSVPSDFERHVALGSLPGMIEDARRPHAPGARGWLAPDPNRVAEAEAWARTLPPGLRVGVAWRSGFVDVYRRRSYVGLADLRAALEMPGVVPISLQYGGAEEEIAAFESRTGIVVHRRPGLDLRDDFEGVAAMIAGLDLVLAAPTAVGELSGAIGVPTWRLCDPDWTRLGAAVRPWMPAQRSFGLRDAVSRLPAALRALRTS